MEVSVSEVEQAGKNNVVWEPVASRGGRGSGFGEGGRGGGGVEVRRCVI